MIHRLFSFLPKKKRVQRTEITPQKSRMEGKFYLGIEYVRDDILPIIYYLKDPKAFIEVGIKPPKKILILGPEGSGKRLLAHVIADQGSAPIFEVDLEKEELERLPIVLDAIADSNQENKSCVIFIRHINELVDNPHYLSKINNFVEQIEPESGIVVIASAVTDREDYKLVKGSSSVDRVIHTQLPSTSQRKSFLKNIFKELSTVESIDLEFIAKATLDFSYSELVKLVNEAKMYNSIHSENTITTEMFIKILDKKHLGIKIAVDISDKRKQITAYHEAGHLLVTLMTDNQTFPYAASIVPRRECAGMVIRIPDSIDRTMSRNQALASIAVLLSGRIGENKLKKGEYSSGASRDFHLATAHATEMICEFGMSKELYNFRTYNVKHNAEDDIIMSDAMHDTINKEINELIREAEKIATQTIDKHENLFKAFADKLLKQETIHYHEIMKMKEEYSLKE